MQYREDKSKNNLSVLGMGCMRFPKTLGMIDKGKTEKILLSAIEKGINYFDTAYIYQGSEEVIGEIFEKNNIREKVYIATKLPQGMCKASADFDRFFNEQKRRLKTEYIDYYLMHNITSIAQWENLKTLGIKQWIADKKAAGEIRQIGFSYHGQRDQFKDLLDDFDWDFVQIQYNYLNINYQAGQMGLRYAAAKGILVIIMEPLLGGRLAVGLPKKAAEIFKQANPDITPAAWALKWLWNQPEVSVVLSGMNHSLQLEENCALADGSTVGMLTKAEEDTIKRVIESFNKSYKIRCTGCNYCMPCPQNINIPGCFTAYNTSYSMGWYTGIKHYFIMAGLTGDDPHYPRDCISCGACEKHCPQGIEIRKGLKKVTRRFEKPLIRPASRVVRWFLRREKNNGNKQKKS